MTECDLVVVGGGPAGSFCALAMARLGLDVLLVDKSEAIVPSTHTVTVQPNGLAALSDVGALVSAEKRGHRLTSSRLFDDRGDIISFLNFGELQHPYPYLLNSLPSDLTEVLRTLFITAGGRILSGCRFESLLRQTGVVTGISARRGAAEVSIRSGLVVGADGPFSLVRKEAGLSARIRAYADVELIAHLDGSTRPNSDARTVVGEGMGLGILPLGEESSYLFVSVAGPLYDLLRRKGFDYLRARIAAADSQIAALLNTIRGWSDFVVIRPICVRMRTWTLPGLALVGDAAHAMHPSTGQALNLALVDALALRDCLERKNDGSVHFRREDYERRRRRQTEYYLQQSDLFSSVFNLSPLLWRSIWPWGRTVLRRNSLDARRRMLILKGTCGLVDRFTLREQLSLFL